jgi:hypothetical protein
MLDPATASHSLGEMLGLGKVAAKEVYAALDWLGREQPFIEAKLARRYLKNGALLLYDITSTYLEGRCCELAQHGYSRDHRADRPQIVIGLMCTADRRLPGRGRGVRRQYRRSDDAVVADRQAEAAF